MHKNADLTARMYRQISSVLFANKKKNSQDIVQSEVMIYTVQ